MTKRKVIILIMAMIFLLAGCSNNESNDEANSGYNHGDEIVEMSDEEVELLCSIYVNEDGIREGKLHDYQQQALEEFRMAKSYLQEKYPGYVYNFYLLSPSDRFDETTEIEFAIDESNGYYTVRVELVDGEYVITDNFFGYVLEPAFDDMLEKKLREAGLSSFGVYTNLSGFVGRDIDAETTAEELLVSGDEIKKDITVWVDMLNTDETENQRIAALVENTVRELKIYGGHRVYFDEGIVESCPTFWDLVEYRKKDNLVSIGFDTFDL
ncbi:MAG: hypothetical protein E7257_09495 [Lachnospiraceae bacterium]|nr:hypothetical protein [Lachnospiraceae bacterium]